MALGELGRLVAGENQRANDLAINAEANRHQPTNRGAISARVPHERLLLMNVSNRIFRDGGCFIGDMRGNRLDEVRRRLWIGDEYGVILHLEGDARDESVVFVAQGDPHTGGIQLRCD